MNETEEKFKKLLAASKYTTVLLDNDYEIICADDNFKKLFENRAINFLELVKKHAEKDLCNKKFEETDIKINFYIENISIEANIFKLFDKNNVQRGFSVVMKNKTDEENIHKQEKLLMAMLSHDLKTPIHAQIQALDLLLAGSFGELSAEQYEIIQGIFASTCFMKNMAENILSTYRNNDGTILIIKTKNSIKKTIEGVVKKLALILSQKSQTLRVVYSTDEEMLEYNETEIKRVINNLVINASEHSPLNCEITVEISKKNNEFIISVKDSGIGIPREILPKIFDEYITVATKYKNAGTGLGLCISRKIVEAHGGNIGVISEEGKGSIFYFTLPA